MQVLHLLQFPLHFQCTFYSGRMYATIQCSQDKLQIKPVCSETNWLYLFQVFKCIHYTLIMHLLLNFCIQFLQVFDIFLNVFYAILCDFLCVFISLRPLFLHLALCNLQKYILQWLQGNDVIDTGLDDKNTFIEMLLTYSVKTHI